nr:hypothetical protein OG690_10300 [Streptomyces tubercidicus]
MSFDPNEIVTIELDCAGWNEPYTCDITRHQLGQVLLTLDDMAADSDDRAPDGTQQWPSPDEAYSNAPSITSESTWIAETAADWETELGREWYLRHAALLDRIALHIALLDNQPGAGRAAQEADATATILLDLDQAPRGYDARAYVRQQYALWRAQECASPEPSHS